MRRRGGFSTLEVLIALAVVVAAGAPLLQLGQAAVDLARRSRMAEATQREADLILQEQVLLSRRELDLRIGERAQGRFTVRIARPERALYRVAVVADNVEQVATVVYRPEYAP